MTREEVVELCKKIYTFYPKFETRTDMIDAWAERMKDLPYEVAVNNLHRYIEQDDIGRVPTIARLLQAGVYRGADFDEKYRENLQLWRYDKDTYIDQNGLLWAYPN